MSIRRHSLPTKVSAEERRLDKEQQELQRRSEELQKTLRAIPKEIEAKKAKDLARKKLEVSAIAPAISLGGARSARSAHIPRKSKPLPAREFNSARIKFLILCLILTTIVVMLWRAIPT